MRAVVSHTDGTAVVTLNAEVSDDLLKETVEAQDYKVHINKIGKLNPGL